MHIVIASDHAGYELKQELASFLRHELGHDVEDLGAHECDPGDDYPDYVTPAAQKVSENPKQTRAIVLGGSGQGEAMCANRIKGVRAAVYYGGPIEIVSLSREHNHANVLSLGARFLDVETARQAVRTWLLTDPDTDPRHERRIKKLDTA